MGSTPIALAASLPSSSIRSTGLAALATLVSSSMKILNAPNALKTAKLAPRPRKIVLHAKQENTSSKIPPHVPLATDHFFKTGQSAPDALKTASSALVRQFLAQNATQDSH